MAKRKQGKLTLGSSDGALSDTSGFGDSEVVMACYQFLPILKDTQVGGGKDCNNQVALISEILQGQRSNGEDAGKRFNGRVKRKPLTRQDTVDLGDPEVLKNFYDINLLWKAMKADMVKDCCDQLPSISVFPKGKRSNGRVSKRLRTGQDAVSDEVTILGEGRNRCLVGINSHNRRNLRSRQRVRPSVAGQLDSQKFEFYIENIWRRLTEERKRVLTYLDSLWFSLYIKGSLKRKVLDWIQRKNIFSKKYVFVPIVQWNHWSLLILCNFNESPDLTTKSCCMLLLDSLQQANAKQLEPGIRRFIFDLFKTEGRPESKEHIKSIPLLIPKVPQQRNGEECGFFVLYYIYRFLESALGHFSFSLGCTHFIKEDWFNPEEVECFIRSLGSINNDDSV